MEGVKLILVCVYVFSFLVFIAPTEGQDTKTTGMKTPPPQGQGRKSKDIKTPPAQGQDTNTKTQDMKMSAPPSMEGQKTKSKDTKTPPAQGQDTKSSKDINTDSKSSKDMKTDGKSKDRKTQPAQGQDGKSSKDVKTDSKSKDMKGAPSPLGSQNSNNKDMKKGNETKTMDEIDPKAAEAIAKKDQIVWNARAEQAKKAALQAYNPNPHHVMNQFNSDVHKATEEGNTTGRNLRSKHGGPCLATNPIDQCFRCDKNWKENRMRLADCGLGFGRNTTGGKGGPIYVVTDASDDDMVNPKPGTLRHAVIQPGPLWITFKKRMVIRLNEELIMTGNKTIDGRGAQVHIAYGAGLTIQFVQNVILHNLHVHDIKAASGGTIRSSVDHFGFRSRSDGDGISIFGSTNVWVDHISMYNCQDGLIDVIEASTAVTISNCHFTKHNEAMLFGASDAYKDDKIMQVTVAFNHFGKGLVQRMPRCRWGFVHIVNNDYTHWLMYAIGGSSQPTILSQGNRFIAPMNPNAKEVTKRDYATESVYKNWVWRSQGDVMLNGAYFVESGDPKYEFFSGAEMIAPKPGEHVNKLTNFAGYLSCKENKPC